MESLPLKPAKKRFSSDFRGNFAPQERQGKMFGNRFEETEDPDAKKIRLLANGVRLVRQCDKLASEYRQLGGKGYLERRNVLGVSLEDTVEEIERRVRSFARRKAFYQRKVDDLMERASCRRTPEVAIKKTPVEIARKAEVVKVRIPRRRPLAVIAGRILIYKKNAA